MVRLLISFSSDYVPLVDLFGVYYQVRDDYMNLQSPTVRASTCTHLTRLIRPLQYADNKGFAEDLTEGKFSFPIVHAVRADTSNRQILSKRFCPLASSTVADCFADVLQKRPTTPTLKRHAVNYLQNHTRSFDYTIKVLRSLETQIRAEIARLGGNTGLERIMDSLHIAEES